VNPTSGSDDCAEAIEHLYELLDNELTPELTERIRRHFASCPECFPRYEFESAFKRFLRARTASRAAPPDLRRRVFERILLDGATDTDA
jgi:anti-sigma factor (TIGR02949 family)